MKQQHSGFMRWTSRVMMVLMMSVGMPMTASANMVETDQAVNHALAEQSRVRIMALVGRDDVRAQLEAKGVTSEQAQARVNALTDEEAIQVSGKLDQLPAGGDILGFTKIFPFTRSINR